jgi:hypothetical protein
LAQRKKESKSNTFWKMNSDCRRVPTSDGCHDFIRTPIGTFWKAYQVYFPTDLDSCRYLIKYVRSSHFNTETFSVHGAASPDCCPMGRVSSGAQ